MRAALVQLTSSDDPGENLARLLPVLRAAAAEGARLALTPEVTNCVSASRTRQREVLRTEAADPTLAAVREVAAETGLWVLIGSLALKAANDPQDRFVNRSFLIDGAGAIRARYDKIHMFDVEIGGAESYRESAGYRPGQRAVLAETPWGRLGLTICYDMRFPALYRRLAQAGAEILTVPSAFTVPTGRAHWEVLLRARAIETGAFVLAPAQTGRHAAARGRIRETWGHSLAIGPWGELLADAGTDPGMTLVELDTAQVAEARGRIPSLSGDRAFAGP
ncbi:carbon-nitrogen hydrolase family protein [Paralimibaculum aggregatum]|uniref:carbon-nitrogen hydrolase family protein n=1 Tax=Paralimibaculum aggregatum TaxID=3036245 RepID=UPI0025546C9D|nr:carbon-nitrogen hydrolase family protein [Limibaculum sp. NKW23]